MKWNAATRQLLVETEYGSQAWVLPLRQNRPVLHREPGSAVDRLAALLRAQMPTKDIRRAARGRPL